MQTSRRTVLGGMLGTAVIGFIPGCSSQSAPAAVADTSYPWPMGTQLFSVIRDLAEDFEGTLAKVAELGFERVESAGFMDRSPEDFRKAVEAVGLRCDSAHVPMVQLSEDIPGMVSQVRDAGCEMLIVASPRTPDAMTPGPDWLSRLIAAMTVDAWKQNAEWLNQAAEEASRAGIALGYHNHSAEFALYDGQAGYDILLTETDPEKVKLELDVAWAAAGGADPIALLQQNAGRVVRLHLKDLVQKPTPGQLNTDFSTSPLGTGVIDWPPIIAAAKEAGVGGAYVEVEMSEEGSHFDLLAKSRDYLKSL